MLGRKQRLFYLPVFFLFASLFFSDPVYGKNARLTLISEKTAVTAGERFIVTLEIRTDEAFTRVESFLGFDREIASFVSADEGISGGEGRLRLTLGDPEADGYDEEYMDDYPEKEEDDGKTRETYELIFRAKKAGIFSLSFIDGIKVFAGKDSLMSVSGNTLSITVKNKREASSDSSLASVRIAGFRTEPEFSKSVLDYDIRVGKDTKRLTVSADPSDENSTVKIEGHDPLLFGNDQFKIKVTAENGSETVYRFNIVREKEATKTEIGEEKEPSLERNAGEPEEIEDASPSETKEEIRKNTEIKSEDGNFALFYGIMAAVTLIAVIVLLMYYLYKKNKDDLF